MNYFILEFLIPRDCNKGVVDRHLLVDQDNSENGQYTVKRKMALCVMML